MVKKNVVLFLALIGLMLTLVGCGDNDTPVSPTKEAQCPTSSPVVEEEEVPKTSSFFCESQHFTVRVTPALAGHLAPIQRAFARWPKLLSDKVTFDVSVSDKASSDWESCIISLTWEDMTPNGSWAASSFLNVRGENFEGLKPGSAVIHFNSNPRYEIKLDDGVVYAVTVHELGHILGLDHDEARDHESVMRPFLEETAGRVGCEDVRRACVIWDCVPPCEGTGWAE